MPYITAKDMQLRYDWKLLGDLISDSGERVQPQAQITHPNMIAACTDASGEVDAALMYGDRYSSTDLSGLVAAGPSNSLNLLIQICCQIAICNLYERKYATKFEVMKPFREAKEGHLERLRTGSNVFNLPTVQAAATEQASGPSLVDYQNSGLVSHYPGMHYFPVTRPTFNNG